MFLVDGEIYFVSIFLNKNKFRMNKLSFLFFLNIAFLFPFSVSAVDIPEKYIPLHWVKESGIETYMKVPENAGVIDYVTVIQLQNNEVVLVSSSTPRIYEGPAIAPFQNTDAQNWLFPRSHAEVMKQSSVEAKFVWNAPFFNIDMPNTVLSLGLKSVDAQGKYISTGGRPQNDMVEKRKMLLIDNASKTAKILDFDESIFVSEGDQGVEGFDPFGSPSNKAGLAARVFIGVRAGGKELIIYCSRNASKEEASAALVAFGVSESEQIQLDGGGSATCGYNLPGQYFVEPGRALPHLMAALPRKPVGKVTLLQLNVRSGAGSTFAVTRKISKGEQVTLFEQKNGWYRISSNEWVSSQYIEKQKSYPYTAQVQMEDLNVRSGAGTSFQIVKKLPLKQTVSVIEEKGEWAKISEGEWIFKKYIQAK